MSTSTTEELNKDPKSSLPTEHKPEEGKDELSETDLEQVSGGAPHRANA